MRRVSRAGGWVGGYVWDYAEGMQLLRRFWDAALALDPGALGLDEGRRFPLCAPGPLRRPVRGGGAGRRRGHGDHGAPAVPRLRRRVAAVPRRPGPRPRLLRAAARGPPGRVARPVAHAAPRAPTAPSPSTPAPGPPADSSPSGNRCGRLRGEHRTSELLPATSSGRPGPPVPAGSPTAQEAHTGRVDSASSARGGGGQPDGARRAQATCSQVVAVTEQRTPIPTYSGRIARNPVLERGHRMLPTVSLRDHRRPASAGRLRQQRPNLRLNSVSQRRQRRPHVAVLDPSGGAGVLALHPGRSGALLQEPGLVDLCGYPHRSTYADTATMPRTRVVGRSRDAVGFCVVRARCVSA